MAKKDENGQVNQEVKTVFTSLEEAEANPRRGKSKDGKELQWELFCTEFPDGTKLYTWSGGGGVAQVATTSHYGVRTYKAHGGRRGGVASLSTLVSKWDEIPEEEKEKLKAKLREEEKAKKAAAKAGKGKKEEPVAV